MSGIIYENVIKHQLCSEKQPCERVSLKWNWREKAEEQLTLL